MKRPALLFVGGTIAAIACSDNKTDPTSSGTQGTSTTGLPMTTTGMVSSSAATSTTGVATTGAGGTTGTTGTTGMAGEAGMLNDPDVFVAPEWLSETGLYEADMQTLAPGVVEFQPQFALWSDTAAKQRWVKLPEGTQIDTNNMDYWVYPVGTKLFKEFTRDEVRVETRLLQKVDERNWFMRAFQWNDAQTDAEARAEGVLDASGTDHDIPSQEQCENCHDKMPDVALGFTAIQLSHSGPGLTIDQLAAEGRLSAAPAAPLVVPGTPDEQAALGYLHANCGNCHQPRSFLTNTVSMHLWLPTSALGSVAETPTIRSTVNVETVMTFSDSGAAGAGGQSAYDIRIVPGDPESSVLYRRIASRETGAAMPPVGSELIDDVGRDVIFDWIEAMPLNK